MARIYFLIIFAFFLSVSLSGQTSKEKAQEKKDKAIDLMDNGKSDEAIKLLEEAKQLDPDNHLIDYEIGYAYNLKKDYTKAIKIFKKLTRQANNSDQCFQMLGNIYDETGNSQKALKTYNEGLKKFPKSGRLFLEKGNVFFIQQNYDQALPFYEQGISVDPAFTSNYYRATLLYFNSSEPLWGMIYGEIFINLEINTKRAADISKFLFDAYKNNIIFTSDTSYKVSFSKNPTININNINDLKNFKLPYGLAVYEPNLSISVLGEKTIDINSLDRIRKRFVEFYFQKGFNKKYPNVLFDYQDKILKAGHLEAYNHWILMKGDENNYKIWKAENKDMWDDFVKWMKDNPMIIDENIKFHSSQYQ